MKFSKFQNFLKFKKTEIFNSFFELFREFCRLYYNKERKETIHDIEATI